jgi:hypothetical protein
VDQRAAQAEFLPHAAGQFLGRAVGERRQAGAAQKFGDTPVPLGLRLSEQTAEEFDVFADAQIGIEILAEPLRHEGDMRTDRVAMARIRHITAEHDDAAGLHAASAGQHAEQCRLADAVRSDQPHHATGRQRYSHVVERDDAIVALRDIFQLRNRRAL